MPRQGKVVWWKEVAEGVVVCGSRWCVKVGQSQTVLQRTMKEYWLNTFLFSASPARLHRPIVVHVYMKWNHLNNSGIYGRRYCLQG